MKITNILIVDDHALFRAGLVSLLQHAIDHLHIGEASNAAEALISLRAQEWDLIFLDICFPDTNGIQLLKEIRASSSQVPVIMLTSRPESEFGLRAMQAGATGYLTKNEPVEKLINAIKRVTNGERYISSKLAESLVAGIFDDNRDMPHLALSDREYEVFLHLASGKTVSETAHELHVSVKTISTHRANILKKMNMKNNAQLIHYAIQHQLS